MTSTITFTPEAVKAVLLGAGFTEYDDDDRDTPGFEVFKAWLGPEIIAELKCHDRMRYNPGKGPRALLDDYLRVLDEAGYVVRSTGIVIVVSGVED